MSYYTAIRHATPRNISAMYYVSSKEHQKTLRKASPTTLRKMIKEENTRRMYLSLHAVNKRAKQIADFTAKNNHYNDIQEALQMYTRNLNTIRSQNWSNYDVRLSSYYPYPRLTIRKIIYYLKQHLKRLEFPKFLAGRKAAEMMMPKAKKNFKTLCGPNSRC